MSDPRQIWLQRHHCAHSDFEDVAWGLQLDLWQMRKERDALKKKLVALAEVAQRVVDGADDEDSDVAGRIDLLADVVQWAVRGVAEELEANVRRDRDRVLKANGEVYTDAKAPEPSTTIGGALKRLLTEEEDA